ncbi:ATP-binding cassette domain-containing protein [Actinosynnema sp. ALI-1.44]|uniref:ATP-binding cassette domain-containing protein n=1 Tax=Actinosynnema sp. ALI-1.44 TaxID=1933779 RepID=UPI001EDC118F|nr:ABC transporter ATP-binding protein [Actinosynnema sp. ALI-1.44]
MAGDGKVLRVRNVAYSYGRNRVLRDVNFELTATSVVGVVGENGAGKSTLLRVLTGDLPLRHGVVEWTGSIAYCPQQPVLNPAFTVAQHLEFFRVAYGLADLRWAEEIMDVLRFRRFLDHRVGALSGGSRQKLNLTLTLMCDPGILLLDEPYQGFDWETYLRFWELTAVLRDRGRTVLIVSHLAHDTAHLTELYRLDSGVLTRDDRVGGRAA